MSSSRSGGVPPTADGGKLIGLLLIGVAVLYALHWLFAEIRAHWVVILGILLIGLMGVAFRWVPFKAMFMVMLDASRQRDPSLVVSMAEFDAATPGRFEDLVAALMNRDGIRSQRVGGAGDQSVDVLGRERDGRGYAVQCKHTTTGNDISPSVLYQLNGTAFPVFQAAVAIVVTNGGFTAAARAWGADRSHRIHLLDREKLAAWGAGRSLYSVLGIRPSSHQEPAPA